MKRPARLAPEFPTDDLVVDALPRPEASTGLSRFMPLFGIVAMAGVGALMWGSGMASRGPTAIVLPAMMLVSVLGMALHAGARRSGGSVDRDRRRYLAHLERLSGYAHEAARAQHAAMLRAHPAPAALWTLVGGPRMWERGEADSDFCHVRVGVGRQRLARRIVAPPVDPVDELDPVTADALRRFVRTHTTLDDMPFAVALRGTGVLVVDGDPTSARSLVRAMLCQLAVLHDPRQVAISAVADDERRLQWDWLKWLPHNNSADHRGRHRVVVVDGVDHRAHAGPGATVIIIGEADRAPDALRLRIDGDKLAVGRAGGIEEFATADAMTTAQARICARRLARYRGDSSEPDANYQTFEPMWRPLPASMRLRVPLGTSTAGEPVFLDIKEAADGGHGPHGLCVGATGSGKSELLRTIAAGMIARHSPDDLNLVLIDFKGGATFLGLERLHHVSAVITNLADAAPMVARAKDALGGEIHRRQQLLRRAGNSVHRAAYQRQRAVDPSLPPLPALFVIVDEFAELLAQQPDFAELFTMIGRVGRSLGVHLLLASQRLDEGRLRGLESHLSYRICLKTATAAESRAVLGVADAAELPAAPGAAVLRTGDGRLVRFQAMYLGGPAPRPVKTAPVAATVRLFTAEPAGPEIDEPAGPQHTALEAIVERFTGLGTPAHRMWLPPLTRSPNLADLEPHSGGDLMAVIGLIDLPFEQRQAPMALDLAGALGNVAVVGAPQSGKSTTVRTIITALAVRSEPRRIQFYCIDFGGGALEELRRLPHVGSVAGRREPELVRRTVSHVGAILSARETLVSVDQDGDVFFVVDGWSTLREEYADLEPVITGIATRGLSFGVHLIVTAGRWADIRPALKDQIGTRVELRLGDPIDSEMDRKQAALVPVGVPGRGITREGNHFLIATPDGVEVDCDGPWRAPGVRLLPVLVEHGEVIELARDDSDRILLGVGEDDFCPVAVDFGRQAHLLILGDRECGKTATLRTLCGEIVRVASGRPAQLFVVDYRRDLLDIADSPHLLDYAFSERGLADRLPDLVSVLQDRLPTADTPIAQLRDRSWWHGPEIFVVVDDYDIVAATSPDALSPLLALLPHARDIGLHMIVARRCAGSARAMFEPLFAHLRDNGSTVLLMSGSPDEGPLSGPYRATVQPPGRGLLVSRAGTQLVQVGWCPP
ncbi:type VII secretion protein EccCb [Mycolicibacterium pallens]|uniref:Type VII secretion protein EccCb n=1 Tax=Mycolicibacterium pallens TaxID=370524 RepID=A0ABX8VDM5_9MYCO|nr:type VII secretion protein EccCb [Mycolicibacterium pallens]QYL15885.1 type VII secretion protein EccCb [Mycolicibacterium pallens]